MNKNELGQLMQLISAVDNREVTATVIEAWMPIVGHIGFDDAKQALIAARSDTNIGRLEPKHIIAKHKLAVEKRNIDKEQQKIYEAAKSFTGQPCPQCSHGLKIIACADCCAVMAETKNPSQTFYALTGVRVPIN